MVTIVTIVTMVTIETIVTMVTIVKLTEYKNSKVLVVSAVHVTCSTPVPLCHVLLGLDTDYTRYY